MLGNINYMYSGYYYCLKCKVAFDHIIMYSANNFVSKVDKKAMIRNRYNQIPILSYTPGGKGTPTIRTVLK